MQYGVEVNILRAQIDRLNETAYAFFVIQLSGEQNAVERSLTDLERKGITILQLPHEAAT